MEEIQKRLSGELRHLCICYHIFLLFFKSNENGIFQMFVISWQAEEREQTVKFLNIQRIKNYYTVLA